ncbi:MAG: transcriptional regulator MraZ [Clostridiales bacterium]|uniref:division/cell wall cluster transcriptional repressor MraZ n=1 Tax=Bovifimicola ammoniilytica TaxID=2981720 RepID=UPI000338B2FF|nr:division/cell wall cluster transcriptional repressor MraZ [Bovifimicola ammoniilytica]MBD8942956.1 transcriptional regulator MraZ [Clostridiales bacterium]MDD6293314.1 division/cell wall cluster transcriptional repressor MraZ [Eubacteriales bacterium]MDY2608171.1 division/cell wall cluster transcriptional repressor MraZ [Lachnospiraceae bacterium]CCZ03096.1 protein MraZ [Eubacterium sp. CAG:603]SCJ77962.1 cell division protein MraZ [uncultured Eubacterium sp.]
MFLGEYNHSIDAKGRLIVPAKFREELGENFIVTKGLDGCLYIYPDEEWKKFESKLSELPMGKGDTRKIVRFFLSAATQVELDKQGRILIPGNHREFAGLEKDVVFAGVGKKIEIWSKEKWEETATFDYEEMDDVAERMADLGIEF